jgi:hypothetical protein
LGPNGVTSHNVGENQDVQAQGRDTGSNGEIENAPTLDGVRTKKMEPDPTYLTRPPQDAIVNKRGQDSNERLERRGETIPPPLHRPIEP